MSNINRSTLRLNALINSLEKWGKVANSVFHCLWLQFAKNIPQDQVWFWSSEWQELERQAENDIKTGQVAVFDNMDDLLADLKTRTVV